VADNPASRIVKSKAALRNKLLKNAKSFQRKKNLREEKQLGNEAEIEDKESRKMLRKKKVPLAFTVGDVQGVEKQSKRSLKPRNLVSEIPSGAELPFPDSDPGKKKSTSKTLEIETLDETKAARKKKRLVDRLSASLKARTQLRTNDGKFARVAAKKVLATLNAKSIKIGRRPVTDPLRLLTRSKLRAAAKMAWKEHTKISRRMTRLRSLDADKTTPIENKPASPVVKEDTNELAKLKRNSSLSRRSLDGSALEIVADKAQEKSLDNKPERASPAVGRGRRSKKETPMEAKPGLTVADESSLNKPSELSSEPKTRSQKNAFSDSGGTSTKVESKTRRSLTSKDVTTKESNTELPKKSQKSPLASPFLVVTKEDKDKIGLTTRSNSRIKRDFRDKNEYSGEIAIKKNTLPKEVSDKKILKRLQKEIIDKKLTVIVEKSLDLEAKIDASLSLKKEKALIVRKSPRNKEADSKGITYEVEAKTLVEKSIVKSGGATAIIETKISSDTIDKHFRCLEDKDVSEVVKKIGPAKRRGRAKRVIENTEEIKASEVPLCSQENEKANNHMQSKSASEIEESTSMFSELHPEEELLPTNRPMQSCSNLQNLSLGHLQQESSNSNMDSGKENSSETIVNISKLKIARPKKWRGLRRENKAVATKRSLNSVIGILTEGVNLPLDTQDSTVVLTVQTSIDSDNSENNNPENTCEKSDELTLENSSSNFDESHNKSVEICNSIAKVDATVIKDTDNINDEKINEVPDNIKFQENDNSQSNEVSEIESTSNIENKVAKENNKSNITNSEQPANDIILDLSRRKPKGKGSFLEKIVSKIAKQKDVSLDSINNCHTDGEHISLNSQNNLKNTSKLKIQEDNNLKELEKIASETLTNEKENVKLNASTIVNIVNTTESSIILLEDIRETEASALAQNNKINIDKKSIKNVDIQTNPTIPIFNKEEVETQMQQKQKSKKRSFESNLSKTNKKKIVDNEDEDDENKEEISLADIMKLIERPKSRAILNTENETVKVGKRKTPDDDKEFNVNMSIESTNDALEVKKDKEIVKKLKRRSGQKKQKSDNDYVVKDTDIVKKEHKSNIDVNITKQCKEDVIISATNNTCEIIQKESAIISKLTTDEAIENNLLKNQDIDIQINEINTLTMEKVQEIKMSKDEIININHENVPNSESENFNKIETIPNQKKRLSKKCAKDIKCLESCEKSPIMINESFKIPEATETVKSIKKRTLRRRFNIKSFSNDQDLEKDKDDIVDKHVVDEKLEVSDDCFDLYSSMSESEEKSIPKQTTKRFTRNSKHLISEEANGSIKELDDSDSNASLKNELQPLKHKRSQRKNLVVVTNDVSLSSIDEIGPSTDCKPVNFQCPNKNDNKHISESNECSKLIDNIENTTMSENKNTTELDNIKLINESLNKNRDKIEENAVIEETVVDHKEKEEHILTSEDETEFKIKENFNSTIENESTVDIVGSDDKISHTPDSYTSSFDDNFDAIDESLSYDLQTSKKRLAGNFTIVTKSGKVLIVEKKKKFTKEVPKFFCNVCTTSFTRKSSLKKHNLSQSHIQQTNVSTDKDFSKENQYQFSVESEDITDDSDQNGDLEKEEEKDVDKEDQNKEELEFNEENKKMKKDHLNAKRGIVLENEIIKQLHDFKVDIINANVIEDVTTSTIIIPEPSLIHKSPEEELEDEMLDEEICKITENMSHDEYVLTDHVSPASPEIALNSIKEKDNSIKEISKVIELDALTIKTVLKTKKERKKKKLSDEHLDLNTPMSIKMLQTKSEIKSMNGIDVQNSSEDKNILKNDLSLNKTQKIIKSDDFSESVSERETTANFIDINNKKENKSKKGLEKKNTVNEIRRTNRNRNQNVGVLESSRPKRNQLRPSYKEDENFDFDVIDTSEDIVDNKHESRRSKRDKKNLNFSEIKQNDYNNEISVKKPKETLKTKRDEGTVSFIETENSDTENKGSIKKGKDKKNQNKKKFNKLNKEDYIESTNLKIERKINEHSIAINSKLKLEQNENKNLKLEQVIVDETVSEVRKTEIPKKKRGRKPKQVKDDKEIFITEEKIFPVCNKVPIVVLEPVKENPKKNHEQEIHTNHKVILKKIECRRKKNNETSIATENMLNFDKVVETEIVEKEKLALEIKLKNDEKISKLNSLFDTKFEKTLTDQSEVTVSLIPVEVSKFPKISADLSEDLINKISDDVQQQLIFPNLNIDNFKSFDDTKNDLTVSMLTGFDSDDNSLDTNMSVDIQKLLNDPEMTTEIAKQSNEDAQNTNTISNIEPVDVINIKEPVPRDYVYESSTITTSIDDNNADIETISELKNQVDSKRNFVNKKFEDKKPLKVLKHIEEKKLKRRGRKPKNNSNKLINGPPNLSDESDIEENKQDDKVLKSKNKIVKSVFGRVFAGEKVDKVKEVLDDWQSRSENNSSDSEAEKSTKNSRLRTRKSLRGKMGSKKSIETNGRSRQSKRRAEELISRAFNDDSPISDKNRIAKYQRLSKRNQGQSISSSEEKLDNEEISHDVILERSLVETKQVAPKSKRGRKKLNVESVEVPIINLKQSKYKPTDEAIGKIINKSEELQVFQSTIDQNKLNILEVENTTNNEFVEDEGDEINGRVSPLYTQDSSDEDNTLRSTSSSYDDNEDEEIRTKSKKNKPRSSASVFAAEKVVIRSPQVMSSHEDTNEPTEMVTIAPTDAVEDNALDLEIPSSEKNIQEKPARQATKVLNFDEELFVECCSRLKATSEKELRGAKKIKLDHSSDQAMDDDSYHHQHHHKKDEQSSGYKGTKDRWRDVESQNSLGSLLESVNQVSFFVKLFYR
jgi:hypothetical protein